MTTTTQTKKMATVDQIVSAMLPLMLPVMAAGASYSSAFSVAANQCSDLVNSACNFSKASTRRMVEISARLWAATH